MTARKNYIVIMLIFCGSMVSYSENLVGIIRDHDGFTNVRIGPGIEFNVTDTLFPEDLFYFDPAVNSNWIKVTAWKGKQVDGFVHRSRIQAVVKLPHKEQAKLIRKILSKQKELADNFWNAWESGDSLGYVTTRRELEQFNDIKYDQMLDVLPEYFCATKDTGILQLLFATISSDKGSANEMPSFAIGECTVCLSEIVFAELRKLTDNGQKKLLYDDIEWGLLNHFYVDEDGLSDNSVFNKLKKKLNIERKNAGL